MTNLLRDYFPAVPAERWHQLASAVRSSHQVLSAIIEQDQRPQRKQRARLALAALAEALAPLEPRLAA